MLTFMILAAMMVVGALGVVLLKQPVHAALSLVATLLTLAVIYVTLEAHFLAAIQVIVYAGAIMVLFLFVIMLLNVQGDGGGLAFRWMRPAAYAVGLLAMLGLVLSIFRNPSQMPDLEVVRGALQGGGPGAIAEALFSEFVLAFQLVGVLLLTGIIGAVSLVQRKAETVYQPQAVAVGTSSKSSGLKTISSTGGAAVLEAEGDDLKRIKGVGPKLEKLLHQNGIFTFKKLAGLSQTELEKLDTQLEEFKGRIWRDDWLTQAKQLADEKRHS